MIQNIQSDELDILLVKACHQAIRNTYGKIKGQAKNRNEIPNFDRENIRIRTGLSRCKNSETFREFITDFWSRAGKIETLQNNWEELMNYVVSEKYWKKSRDLALLALASYKKSDASTDSVNEQMNLDDENEETMDLDDVI